jgi:hypothetical protein
MKINMEIPMPQAKIMANNPIPPRSRARCCADSPRRGEYGALWLFQCDHQEQTINSSRTKF